MSKGRSWLEGIGLVVAILSLVLAWVEHRARVTAEERTGTERVAKELAQAGETAAREELERERARLKDKLLIFVQEYQRHVQGLNSALASLESKDMPHDEALKQLRMNADAMVAFVEKYKVLMARLASLMNGTVTRLSRASASGDVNELAAAVGILEKNIDGDLAALREAIEDLGK